jgi:hypothetical protein
VNCYKKNKSFDEISPSAKVFSKNFAYSYTKQNIANPDTDMISKAALQWRQGYATGLEMCTYVQGLDVYPVVDNLYVLV